MAAPITVLTTTIPGRERMLVENMESVYRQSVPVARQIIDAHHPDETLGEPMVQYSKAKNRMLPGVKTQWVAVLNDDDFWLPNHVEQIAPHLKDADVIYTFESGNTRPRVNINEWTREQLIRQITFGNIIDGNSAIRTSLLRKVGGFPTDWVGRYPPGQGGHYRDSPAIFEDQELWLKLLAAGARFRCVPEITYHYRTGHDRISMAP